MIWGQSKTALALLGVLAGLTANAPAASAADDEITIAIPTFLSGPAAGAFGVPARNGAELVVDAINAGTLPAPYDTKGFAGVRAKALFVDEAGGNARQVRQYHDLVETRGVDLVVGYISSGSCTALAPVIEALRRLTIFAVCGTPRIFEEAPRRFIFRTMSHATADSVAAARYLRAKFPGITSYTGINQDYAWGRDSWRDFDLAMEVLAPGARTANEPKFTPLFSGDFDAEILDLLFDEPMVVHSSFWGGDLESLIFQGAQHDFFKARTVVLTVGESAVYRLLRRMPDGLVIGARGPYGALVRDRKTPLNTWFIKAYRERYGAYPSSPAYQYGQGILAAKIAYDQAALANGGNRPTQDEVIAALEGLRFQSFSTEVNLALSGGHQAVTEHAYGRTRFNAETREPEVVDIQFFPADCVMPPDGVTSSQWLKSGLTDAPC